uniref:Uncharacterized protein n=1 Tax=Megaselia scalaris TaxID=36166 RepID=T1GX13_MEGSC
MEINEENKTFLNNSPAPRILPLTEHHIPPSEPNQKWGNLLILVGLATTIGSAVPVGYCIGVINSPSQ